MVLKKNRPLIFCQKLRNFHIQIFDVHLQKIRFIFRYIQKIGRIKRKSELKKMRHQTRHTKISNTPRQNVKYSIIRFIRNRILLQRLLFRKILTFYIHTLTKISQFAYFNTFRRCKIIHTPYAQLPKRVDLVIC